MTQNFSSARIAAMNWTGVIAAALCLAGPAHAQLAPPAVPQLPRVGGVVDRVTGMVPEVGATLGDAQALVRAQAQRTRDLVRRHPDRIALDPDGNAVRAGELIVLDADDAVTRAAAARGFRLIEQVELDGLGVGYARFATPRGVPLKRALRQLKSLAGGREVSADPLYFASGTSMAVAPAGQAPSRAARAGRIGIIDGGVSTATPGLARQQGFASGGPRPSDHAAGIASLLTGGGGVRASAPGAQLYVADIYGGDPAGGNAAALGQALAWMARERVPVVVVSLTGPPNPLLARIVAAARRLGTVVVAAVGNDGPAAKPSYPASYPEAIAVTGVDARGRVLIEAGRATKLDYAAPGADLIALNADGKPRTVRGTSFAAPFVAARLSAHFTGDLGAAISALDREATGGGRRGLGRGLLCGDCATRPR
jgi:hypothetical protein